MRAAPILLVLMFAAPAAARPMQLPKPQDDDAVVVASQLEDAVKAGDAAAVAAHLQAPLRYQGLSFDDAKCARAFRDHGTVAAKQLPAFAACFAHAAALFDALITANIDRGDPPEAADDLRRLHLWIARTGKRQVIRIAASAPVDGGDEDPNGDPGGEEGGVVGGVVGGAADDPPPPPPPPPPPRAPVIVAPTAIYALLIAGDRNILPDAKIKAELEKASKSRAIAAAKLCFDDKGATSGVTLIKSSGYPAWDDEIQRGLGAWRIKPFMVNGKARAVCTAVTFIYAPG